MLEEADPWIAFKVDTTVLRAEDLPVAGLPAIITATENMNMSNMKSFGGG